MIQELDMACKDWGFFRVGANLGVQMSRAEPELDHARARLEGNFSSSSSARA
ncbi:hypothetical protein Hanom_Chr10g00944891 [Helianthus anomalus]